MSANNTLFLNFNKISQISILQSADKQGNPSFHFHAPVMYYRIWSDPVLYYRIWHASRAWKRKTLIFTQLKISRYNQHFFAVLDDFFYKLASDLFTVVWPQRDLVYLRHRMKQNGANFGAHRRHVSKSFQRTEGTGEKAKLIKFALDKIVDLTRIVELPCHLMRPKTV